ncbi:hypothetical protein WJX75_009394 [Coccomyxa subellipsoidea]|uniref:Uncharacterized protein n=1 Tax=Coccomyxa subellipsoidea TaxID=248742 RepID=A0ABR2Z4Q8_9CHLO
MEARKRWKPNFFFSRGLRTIALTAVFFSALQSALGSAKVGGGSNRANSITIKNRRAGKLYSAQCGQVWQGQYARLHAAILEDEPSRQRLAVVKAHKNGLGDRLTAAVTIFYYALLSGRAFRIDWHGASSEATLATVMEKPNVDWEAAEDLAGMWPEARTVVFEINTGAVDKLFYNPYHRQQLFEWGLRPETAVGCALNYLFKPRPEVLELVHENFKALRNPDALKIGIQVRMGDAWLQNKPYGVCDREIDHDDLGRWFRCASKVEEEYRVEGMPVHWYMVSDCPALRYKAAKKYGPKVLLPSQELVTEHITYSTGNTTKDLLAIQTAFAEQWLLGMTDFQVITEESSFGRLAALRSLRFRSVYTMRSPEAMAERSRNDSWECKRSEFDTFEEVAVKHPWVKVL